MKKSKTSKTDELISVYITNFNYGKFIREAIESVLKQTYKNFELIIIDDGSSDNSKEIIKEYILNKKVRVIFQSNKGLNASNNVAIRASKGNFILRLDADDYLDKNALLVLYNDIKRSKKIALTFSDYFTVDTEGKILKLSHRHDFSKKNLLLDQPAHGACSLIRKQALIQVGGYSEEISCQDGWDVWLKIINLYNVSNINLPLFFYRKHGKNLTNNSQKLFNARKKIYSNIVKTKKQKILNTIAIIPVRGSKINEKENILKKLGDKPIICWTIDEVLKSKKIFEIIVATPDEEIIRFVKQRYQKKITVFERTTEGSLENKSYIEDVISAINKRKKKIKKVDLLLELMAESPFKTVDQIELAIDILQTHTMDVVIGVTNEDDIFYKHNGVSLQPVSNNIYISNLRFERDYIYRQTGGIFLSRYQHVLKSKNIFKGRIGSIVLSKNTQFRIKNEFDLKIANLMIKEKIHND